MILAAGAVSVAVWVGSNAMADVSGTHREVVFWGGWSMIGMVGIFMSFIYLFREMTGERRTDVSLRLMSLSAVVVTLLSFSRWATADTLFPPGRPTETVPGPVYAAAGLIAVWGYLYTLRAVRRFGRQGTPLEVHQVMSLFWGYSGTMLGAFVFAFILPVIGYTSWWSLAPQFAFFMLAFTVYAVLKHRVFDIRIAVQRGTVYSALLGVLAVIYAATLVAAQLVTRQVGEINHHLASAITIIVGVMVAPRLRRLFERLTDGIFFKNRCPYEVAVSRLSQVLNRHVTVSDLIEISSSELKEIFRVDQVRFVLLDEADGEGIVSGIDFFSKVPERLLRRAGRIEKWTLPEGVVDVLNEAEMVVPIVHERQPVALLAMGPKLSGEPFLPSDVKILDVFSEQSAVAIVKAQLYMRLQEHSERLAEEVRDRTARLERAYRDRADMMVDIAHGLQTPLTVIKGQIEGMRRSSSGTEEVAMLERSVDKVTAFIKRLIRLASLSARSGDVPVERVDMSELLRDIISYFEVMAEQEGISLEMSIEDGVSVNGSREQLEELVLNVLSNAVKYIANERRISIGLGKRGQSCLLTVSDTGQGIPEECMKKLFKRFYRSPSAKSVAGSGLGLAICERIVDLHGGRISVDSVVGQGTTVRVELPTAGAVPVVGTAERQNNNLQPA